MAIVNPPDASLGSDDIVWIGIIEPKPGQRHCGLIYQITGTLRILHLAFHHLLRDEPYGGDYWWSPVGLDPDNQAALAAIISTIATGHPMIPYGFDLSGIVFDKVTGAILNAPPGTGLTCSTFILAVFNTFNFHPTKLESWMIRPGDDNWQKDMIALMVDHGAADEHTAAVRNHSKSARFRPEEVVGCVSTNSDEWPIEFDKAVSLASEVLADMGIAA